MAKRSALKSVTVATKTIAMTKTRGMIDALSISTGVNLVHLDEDDEYQPDGYDKERIGDEGTKPAIEVAG